MIGIIDYGMGNLKSIGNAFSAASDEFHDQIKIIEEARQIKNFDKLVLPGVGAFCDAVKIIKNKGFDEQILEARERDVPILGICLGMQLLATKSFEHGEYLGLNLIPGEVRHFSELHRPKDESLRIPHIGWNEVNYKIECPLFKDIDDRSDFYFVHSYYYKCENEGHCLATTNYGDDFCSVIGDGRVFGAQFHPEKSQRTGLKMLSNFLRL